MLTGGMNYCLSANSLRNSPKSCVFTKSERFPDPVRQFNSEFTLLPPIKDNRYCTMGSGKRNAYIENLPSFEVPAPTDYDVKGGFDKLDPFHGKSFAIGHKEYENVYIPEAKHLVAPRNAAEIPGPGEYTYDYSKSLGKTGRQSTIKGRIPVSYFATRDLPGPAMYKPNFAAVASGRYHEVSFGLGDRSSGQFSPPASIFSVRNLA